MSTGPSSFTSAMPAATPNADSLPNRASMSENARPMIMPTTTPQSMMLMSERAPLISLTDAQVLALTDQMRRDFEPSVER